MPTVLADIHDGGVVLGTVDTELPVAAALSDATSNPTAPTVGSAALHWNGASWVRWRANEDITVLASAARTADTNSDDLTSHNGRGVIVIVDITANASAAGVTFRIQAKDPVSGKYVELLASAAQTTTGTIQMMVYPGLVTLANVHASKVLSRTFRVVADHGDASSVTYSIGASIIV